MQCVKRSKSECKSYLGEGGSKVKNFNSFLINSKKISKNREKPYAKCKCGGNLHNMYFCYKNISNDSKLDEILIILICIKKYNF